MCEDKTVSERITCDYTQSKETIATFVITLPKCLPVEKVHSFICAPPPPTNDCFGQGLMMIKHILFLIIFLLFSRITLHRCQPSRNRVGNPAF